MKNIYNPEKIAKLIHLDSSKRQLLISTFALLALVKLGLSIMSFKTLHRFMLKISYSQLKNQMPEQISLENIIWALNMSTHYIPGGAKCLARALTCRVFMSRYNYTSQLYIGVAKGEDEGLKAHAWIESQGQVVVGNLPDLCEFKKLVSFSSNSSQPIV
jgi:hypothetical protein